MFVGISGTPGTGKSSVSEFLKKKGYEVIDLSCISIDNNFIIGIDESRDTKIIDIIKLNQFVKKNYCKDIIIFFEGHLSHLLSALDKIILLRCHPKMLKKRLEKKGWNEIKIKENIDAESLDIILCEAVEIHTESDIFEINTTDKSIESIGGSIMEIINNNFRHMKKYNIGTIDWSREILKDF